MHPWHDVYVDDTLIEHAFPVVIEVPMGSKNKYELDKESGFLRLDRVLYSAVYYPANYGFIPRFFCDDSDEPQIFLNINIDSIFVAFKAWNKYLNLFS